LKKHPYYLTAWTVRRRRMRVSFHNLSKHSKLERKKGNNTVYV